MRIKSDAIEDWESYTQFGALVEVTNHFEMWMGDKKAMLK